jgi:putative lipoic acid-binding regulatory protein
VEEKVATICDLNLSKKKLQIDYPCHWEYKVIIQVGMDVYLPLKEVLKDREFGVKSSNKSKKGSYESYNVTVLVTSNEERENLFNALKSHENIKFVL